MEYNFSDFPPINQPYRPRINTPQIQPPTLFSQLSKLGSSILTSLQNLRPERPGGLLASILPKFLREPYMRASEIAGDIGRETFIEPLKTLGGIQQRGLERGMGTISPTGEFVRREVPPIGFDEALSGIAAIAKLSFPATMIPAEVVSRTAEATLGEVPGFRKGEKFAVIPKLAGLVAAIKTPTGKLGEAGMLAKEIKGVAKAEPTVQESVQVLRDAIKRGQELFKSQEVARTLERDARYAKGLAMAEGKTGADYFKTLLGSLKGKLPQSVREVVKDLIPEEYQRSIINEIRDTNVLSQSQRTHAYVGFSKLMGYGEKNPTKYELDLLTRILPEDAVEELLGNRTALSTIGKVAPEILNLPRAIMSSLDFSMPFRQALPALTRHPAMAFKAFYPMIKSAFNDKFFREFNAEILKRPTFELMSKAELALTKLGAGVKLVEREEPYMGGWANTLPIIRQSNQAAITFLNKIRADNFDALLRAGEKMGQDINDVKWLKEIGALVNASTGRGNLPGMLNKASSLLNTLFFSPKLVFSRLYFFDPRNYLTATPLVRKEALKTLLSMGAFYGSVAGLAVAAGAKVSTEPSSDFGKIKVGDTRVDITGGFQQYIRAAYQLWTGKYVSSATGVETTLGEDFRGIGRGDILKRLLQTKEAPIFSFASGLFEGKNIFGDKFDIPAEIRARLLPMVVQDTIDIINSGDLKNLGFIPAAVFGVGVQTYQPTPKEAVASYRSFQTKFRQLMNEGKAEEASRLAERNRDLMTIGGSLEPLIAAISQAERLKKQNPGSAAQFDAVIAEYEKRAQEILDQLRAPGGTLRPQTP